MEPLKKPLKLKFKINYGADFGDNINVIGNIKELGEWKFFNSLKLNWNPVLLFSKNKISKTIFL